MKVYNQVKERKITNCEKTYQRENKKIRENKKEIEKHTYKEWKLTE
jgi:hypothetical protein